MELPSEVQQQIDDLAQVVRHPQFSALIMEIQGASEEERADTASRLASVSELEARGIPIPEGLRITTRWFEQPDLDRGRGERLLAEATVDRRRATPAEGSEELTVCGSVGYIVCGSVGGEVQL